MTQSQLTCLFCHGTGKVSTVASAAEGERCPHCSGRGYGGWDRELFIRANYQLAFLAGLFLPAIILIGQVVDPDWSYSLLAMAVGVPGLIGYYNVYGRHLSVRWRTLLPTLIVVLGIWFYANRSRWDLDLALLIASPIVFLSLRVFTNSSESTGMQRLFVGLFIGGVYLFLLLTAPASAGLLVCLALLGYSLTWILKFFLGYVSAPNRRSELTK